MNESKTREREREILYFRKKRIIDKVSMHIDFCSRAKKKKKKKRRKKRPKMIISEVSVARIFLTNIRLSLVLCFRFDQIFIIVDAFHSMKYLLWFAKDIADNSIALFLFLFQSLVYFDEVTLNIKEQRRKNDVTLLSQLFNRWVFVRIRRDVRLELVIVSFALARQSTKVSRIIFETLV